MTKDDRSGEQNDEDDLTDAFTVALMQTFCRFSKQASASTNGKRPTTAEKGQYDDEFGRCVLEQSELDEFAKTVNAGETMSQEEKAELRDYFDTDKDGRLTFNGFCEMYQLQSSSRPDDTWKDLYALGL